MNKNQGSLAVKLDLVHEKRGNPNTAGLAFFNWRNKKTQKKKILKKHHLWSFVPLPPKKHFVPEQERFFF